MNYENTITITGSRSITKKTAMKIFDEKLIPWLGNDFKWLIGGARGVDHWALEWLIEKNENCVIVVPFTISYQPKSIQPLLNNLKSIGKVIELKLPKHNGSYKKRNEFMVDQSGIVIGFWTGSPGGSHHTLKYGIEKGREVHAFSVNKRK
jgi:predicted Rossmann fold nucleotide-binding protein DprA/Smf involved in DNA uptake